MKGDLAAWTGVMTGPLVWLIGFEAKFALAPWVCRFHWYPALLLVSLVSLLATAGAAALSGFQWQRSTGQLRTLAATGVLLSAGFFLVIAAQALPELLLGGCE
jgi:hypothetical protein